MQSPSAPAAQSDDSVAILGEAWYQASIPLPFGGFKPIPVKPWKLAFPARWTYSAMLRPERGGRRRDPNNSSIPVFVRNPSSMPGRVAVERQWIPAGIRAATVNTSEKSQPGACPGRLRRRGGGANYQRSKAAPLVIAQADGKSCLAWPEAIAFMPGIRTKAADLAGNPGRHTGIGFSLDQRVGDGVGLFARYGKLVSGESPFDQGLAARAAFNAATGAGGDTWAWRAVG